MDPDCLHFHGERVHLSRLLTSLGRESERRSDVPSGDCLRPDRNDLGRDREVGREHRDLDPLTYDPLLR